MSSNTPEQDGAGGWSGGTQQGTPPGPPSQGSAPGQEHVGSAPSQGSAPRTEQVPDDQQRPRRGRHRAPITEAQTRVTWRRVFQYWIDAFLVSLVPYLVSIPFDRSGRTSLHILGGIITFVLFLVIGFWYWILRPKSHHGQTFAMKWFGLRVISKDGDPANTAQYFIRWIGLIIDGFPWVWPFTGLLGLIVMVCSRYRQRVGDHLGRTLVIADGLTAGQAAQYARGDAQGDARGDARGDAQGAALDPAQAEQRYGRPGTGV